MGVISNGTTLLDAGAIDSGVSTGSLTHIKTITASDTSTMSFVHGSSDVVFDGTYKEYIFKYISMHPGNEDAAELKFQVSTNGGTGYGVSIQSTSMTVTHNEADGVSGPDYVNSIDLANSTDFCHITPNNIGNENDENASGELHIFDVASTTFVKHWYARCNNTISSDRCNDAYFAGYVNSTTAINAIQFQMTNGQTGKTTGSGIIKMYGVK
jgi:hypothetical protein